MRVSLDTAEVGNPSVVRIYARYGAVYDLSTGLYTEKAPTTEDLARILLTRLAAREGVTP